MMTRLLCLLLLLAPPVFAKDAKEAAKDNTAKEEGEIAKLNYPELEVSPRATERLKLEAKNERTSNWKIYLPIQFSALATIYASSSVDNKDGLTAKEQDDFDSTQSIGQAVGIGWLVLTGTMTALYKPYRAGYSEIHKLPTKTKRDELTRERLAEEGLYAPDRIGQRLKWFAFASNLGVILAMSVDADTESNMALGIGAVAAFAPFIFESRWTRVAERHREYKKKIYGPISFYSPVSVGDGRIAHALNLHWTF